MNKNDLNNRLGSIERIQIIQAKLIGESAEEMRGIKNSLRVGGLILTVFTFCLLLIKLGYI